MRLRREPGALEAFERKTAWPMLGVVVASLLLAPPSPSSSRSRPLGERGGPRRMDALARVRRGVRDSVVDSDGSTHLREAQRHRPLGRRATHVSGAASLPDDSTREDRGRWRRVSIDQSDAIVKRSNVKYGVMVSSRAGCESSQGRFRPWLRSSRWSSTRSALLPTERRSLLSPTWLTTPARSAPTLSDYSRSRGISSRTRFTSHRREAESIFAASVTTRGLCCLSEIPGAASGEAVPHLFERYWQGHRQPSAPPGTRIGARDRPQDC